MFDWILKFSSGKLKEFLTVIAVNASSLSYWICLFTAIICIILALSGYKKAKSGTVAPIIIYAILQCFLSVLI